jgi:ligand-binding SRPBCC domain-containing protein
VADEVFESRIWIGRRRPDVFEFLTDPANAAGLAPSWLHVRLLTPSPGRVSAGAVLEYRVRLLGLPVRFRCFVREFDPPARFLVTQVRGPFDRWEHRALLLEDGEGTWVQDTITYKLPLGLLARPVRGLAHLGLQGAWRHRRARLAASLGPIRAAGG